MQHKRQPATVEVGVVAKGVEQLRSVAVVCGCVRVGTGIWFIGMEDSTAWIIAVLHALDYSRS